MKSENIFKTVYDGDVLQIPGIDEIETIYNPILKTFEVIVNRKKIRKFVGVQADEAKLQQEMPFEIPEIIKINRALRKVYGVDVATLRNRSRLRSYVEPRQMAMTWLIINSKMSSQKIGMIFKPAEGREFDHATVLHAKKTIMSLVGTNKEIRLKYEDFNKECKNA